MKTLSIAIYSGLFAISGVVSAVYAKEPSSISTSSFYLGERMGWAAFQDACRRNALNCDEDTLGIGVLGGYTVRPWLALEAGVTYYGSPEATYPSQKRSADVYGGELAVKLSYPLSEHLDLFTRLGGMYSFLEKNTEVAPYAQEQSDWSLLSSVGMSYQFSPNWSLRGEYQFVDGIGEHSFGQADLHFTSIGLTYHFGQKKSSANSLDSSALSSIPSSMFAEVEAPFPIKTEVLFDFDSYELSYSSSLETLAQQLTHYNEGRVYVIGYSDNTGAPSYNASLSHRRASAVAQYLKRMGIAQERLFISGQGEEHPKASNLTREGRVQNRRVEVLFETNKKQRQKVTLLPSMKPQIK